MAKKFWEDGIRFQCQGSGKCCLSRGEYGFVYFTLEDRKRMAKVLGLRTSVFTRRFCTFDGEHWHLTDPDKNCRFLDGKRCTVYEGRPAQCRTWPFWPENMNAKAWKKEVVSFCPGVGKGRLYKAEEISALLGQDPVLPVTE